MFSISLLIDFLFQYAGILYLLRVIRVSTVINACPITANLRRVERWLWMLQWYFLGRKFFGRAMHSDVIFLKKHYCLILILFDLFVLYLTYCNLHAFLLKCILLFTCFYLTLLFLSMLCCHIFLFVILL